MQLYVSGVLKTSGYIDGGGNAETGMGLSIAGVGNLSSEGVNGPIFIGGANNANTKPRISNSNVISTDTVGLPSSTTSLGAATINFQYDTAATFTGFRILFSSGNIAAGTISVYGVRK